MSAPLPYLTSELSGIGGTIKDRPDDFFVQEIPLYEPVGSGEHVYFEIQKVGLTTFQAINRIAESLRVSSRDIGYAGLKDARAVTRQVFSIAGVIEQQVMALKLDDLQVLWARRHGNKLRLGHLKGNRFAIKIREVNPTDVVRLRPMLDVLQQRGMPNFFGEQRFGVRGDNDKLGATLIRGRPEELLTLLLGSPNPAIDEAGEQSARTMYDRGDHAGALREYPRRCGMERRMLAALVKGRKPGDVVRNIEPRLRRLWVSALQSRLFNEVVAARIEELDHLLDGDLAYKHDNGACFAVENAVEEQPRCQRFEISATGPLVGYRMTAPAGKPLEIEQSVFAGYGLKATHFKQEGRDHAKGARRPIRVRPDDLQIAGGVDEHGAHVTVAFTLPAGSYATVLLRELMKSDVPVAPQ